jgi:hypothetical protein
LTASKPGGVAVMCDLSGASLSERRATWSCDGVGRIASKTFAQQATGGGIEDAAYLDLHVKRKLRTH